MGGSYDNGSYDNVDTATTTAEAVTLEEPVSSEPLRELVPQEVIATNFPQDWLSQKAAEITARILGELGIYGDLSQTPVLGLGAKRALAVFKDSDNAKRAVDEVQNLYNGGNSIFWLELGSEVQPIVLPVPARPRRVKAEPKLVPPRQRQSNPYPSEASQQYATRNATPPGYDYGTSYDAHYDDAQAAEKVAEEEAPNESRWIVHIDELLMPERPAIDASSTDREVWVDPMPPSEHLQNWLHNFGVAEQVYSVGPDIRAKDGGTDRGYILFDNHASARACVEAGAAQWSESERGLSSQISKGWTSKRAYPESLVSALLGRKGAELNATRLAAGAHSLGIRGAGLSREADSHRLHFVSEGESSIISDLIDQLELRLAAAHQMVNAKITERGLEEWLAERDKCYDAFLWKEKGSGKGGGRYEKHFGTEDARCFGWPRSEPVEESQGKGIIIEPVQGIDQQTDLDQINSDQIIPPPSKKQRRQKRSDGKGKAEKRPAWGEANDEQNVPGWWKRSLATINVPRARPSQAPHLS